VKLRAYVGVDLKTQPFHPEFAGKMNFYLSAVKLAQAHAMASSSARTAGC
jgi:hypothetical protein